MLIESDRFDHHRPYSNISIWCFHAGHNLQNLFLSCSLVSYLRAQSCCGRFCLGNQLFWSVGSWARKGTQKISVFYFNFFPIKRSWRLLNEVHWYVKLQSLASQVRKQLHASRKKGESVEGFNYSTTTMLKRYLEVNKFQSHCEFIFVAFSLNNCGDVSWQASADVPSEPTTLLPKI